MNSFKLGVAGLIAVGALSACHCPNRHHKTESAKDTRKTAIVDPNILTYNMITANDVTYYCKDTTLKVSGVVDARHCADGTNHIINPPITWKEIKVRKPDPVKSAPKYKTLAELMSSNSAAKPVSKTDDVVVKGSTTTNKPAQSVGNGSVNININQGK